MVEREFDITVSIGGIENGFLLVVHSLEASEGAIKVTRREVTYFKTNLEAEIAAKLEIDLKCHVYRELEKKALATDLEGDDDGS